MAVYADLRAELPPPGQPLIDRNISVYDALLQSRYQGLNSRNPKLVCHETRNRRDICHAEHGRCDYLTEAHFQCLEQFYHVDKVNRLRREFGSMAFKMVPQLPPDYEMFQVKKP
eukprot:TRINITY_DN6875_c0_g1_i1.p2 TRINITY_DN6875_c0_g1~~TRINITY_DN6875_c0_g1_i1.p2  ORF type:complete len:114 (-),score=33.56 TRINITY_DN6875_c0_g1_i1:55-396(-)